MRDLARDASRVISLLDQMQHPLQAIQPKDGHVLVLNRRTGEAIVMDGGIRVIVLQCDRRTVRLGIQAPGETGIFREELVVLQASEDSAAGSRR